MRVELLKHELEAHGHTCVVLNLGRNRLIPSEEYETCASAVDFLRKTWRFSRAGFVIHAHMNGDSPKGLLLVFVAEMLGLLAGQRCVLTFHAGLEQVYFPRQKAPWLAPVFRILFAIPRTVVCNSEPVRRRIAEYGIDPEKIHAIPAFSRQYLRFTRVELTGPINDLFNRFPHVLFAYVRVWDGYFLDTLIDGFARIAAARDDVGLLFLGLTDDVDPVLMRDLETRIAANSLSSRMCLWGDLEHDAFLTALTRSAVCLRTPVSDGVASSVLEALALEVPVVAAENGTRPKGVVTYQAEDPADLAAKVQYVLANRAAVIGATPKPEIRDTLAEEIGVLVAASARVPGGLGVGEDKS
jgi:glycosyltransferase involved in cell wall biosynthesis